MLSAKAILTIRKYLNKRYGLKIGRQLNTFNDHHTIIIDGKLFENQFVNIDELIQIFSNFKKHHLTYVLVTHADNLINALDHSTQIFDVFQLLSPQINVVLSEEYEDYQKYLANNHMLTRHMQVIDLP